MFKNTHTGISHKSWENRTVRLWWSMFSFVKKPFLLAVSSCTLAWNWFCWLKWHLICIFVYMVFNNLYGISYLNMVWSCVYHNALQQNRCGSQLWYPFSISCKQTDQCHQFRMVVWTHSLLILQNTHTCIILYNIYTHTYYVYIYIYILGPESKLCMERSAVFRTYGTKGLRNWSCSGPLECDEI